MTDDPATATTSPVGTPIGTEPPRLTGPQTITNELIDAVATSNCGWSRRQVELLGASWPLVLGWREKLVSEERVLSAEQVKALFAAKDARATKRAKIAAAESLPCPWCGALVQRVELKNFATNGTRSPSTTP